jgi:hypothetical protein
MFYPTRISVSARLGTALTKGRIRTGRAIRILWLNHCTSPTAVRVPRRIGSYILV